ncbi:MAG TPA: hypothetical protein VM553_08450 [Dongiaceae bacterium]|nr:hypothetical protein [Dongiaceae bacterium]
MSSSPKFKVIVNGVAEGYHPQRVRAAVGNRFGITPAQVEQLLASQGGLLTELVDHQTAWQLKNLLQQLGVSCRIAPVPLSGLSDKARQMSLQAPAADRHIGHAPMRRANRQSVPMRSGKMPTKMQPRPQPVVRSPLWRMLALVGVAFVLGWYLQTGRAPLQGNPAPVVADIIH